MPAIFANRNNNEKSLIVNIILCFPGFIFALLPDKPEMKLPRYKGLNRDQPPRFLVQLKPHVVNLGFNCHMSCAVTGDPAPQVTWYKGNKNLSQDPAFLCKNDFGVCSLVIPGVKPADAGQYKVLAVNELGQAISKSELTVKGGD